MAPVVTICAMGVQNGIINMRNTIVVHVQKSETIMNLTKMVAAIDYSLFLLSHIYRLRYYICTCCPVRV